MSGTTKQNPNRQSGTVGPVASATKDSGNPTKTTNPSSGVGSEWINTTSGAIFICTDATTNDNTWISQEGSPVGIGDRGCWIGGGNSTWVGAESVWNTIDYITINTLCDSALFGNLTARKYESAGCSNGTNGRGVNGGGLDLYTGTPGATYFNSMDYVTIGTLGNAADLGNMVITAYSRGACSNATNDRGIFMGGQV